MDIHIDIDVNIHIDIDINIDIVDMDISLGGCIGDLGVPELSQDGLPTGRPARQPDSQPAHYVFVVFLVLLVFRKL